MEGKKLQQLLLLVCTGGAVGGGHSGAPPQRSAGLSPWCRPLPWGWGQPTQEGSSAAGHALSSARKREARN